jgi:hypothetical protein
LVTYPVNLFSEKKKKFFAEKSLTSNLVRKITRIKLLILGELLGELLGERALGNRMICRKLGALSISFSAAPSE